MSNGRNAQFMSQKSNFLVLNAITVGFLQNQVPANAGIFDFDIQPRAMGAGNVLEVLGFGHRQKGVTWKSNRISAFWLPWASQNTVHLDIDDTADYFFTSELNGCQFRIARTGGNTLRFVHVAGDSQNSALPVGSAWRNAQAQARFTAPQYALSRSLSSSSLLGIAAPNGTIGYGGGNGWTNVVGFRRWHIFGNATWEVWAQHVTAPLGGGYAANAFHLCTL